MSTKLNILTFNLEECGKLPPASSELFGKIGKMKGEPYKIRLKEDAVPFHISTPKKNSYTTDGKNLDDMEE